MKKNKMMRAASALMVATLLTTSVISGTFAKYVTKGSGSDWAHVAVWGFNTTSIDITDLFKDEYDSTVKSGDEYHSDVIAPGTTRSAKFGFTYRESADAPEVAYTFSVDTEGSSCSEYIENNPNIKWRLDNGDWGNWDTLLADIEALSGDASGTKEYAPGELPRAFNKTTYEHTVTWKWAFDEYDNTSFNATNYDIIDTAMGNDGSAVVNLVITITATQKD